MHMLQRFYREKLEQTRATIEKMKSLETDLLSSLEYLQACQECTSTGRIDSCVQCENDEHANNETPRMVAAIATNA